MREDVEPESPTSVAIPTEDASAAPATCCMFLSEMPKSVVVIDCVFFDLALEASLVFCFLAGTAFVFSFAMSEVKAIGISGSLGSTPTVFAAINALAVAMPAYNAFVSVSTSPADDDDDPPCECPCPSSSCVCPSS